MFWFVVIIICGIIAVILDTVPGKVVMGAAVVAIGSLLLYWITGIAFLITLAKICAIVIVVCIVGAVLAGIIG